MITCNRCRNVSPAGAVNCQTCGAPLSSNLENEFDPSRMAAPQEQPELPAWLESLRAGERPAVPANNASTFSTADLIEDGALPSWMRSGRQEASDVNASNPHPALRSSAMPGPNTDDSSKRINAKSLIDEQALPSWMQENKPVTSPIQQGSISASSLVQPDAAPDWMRALQGSPVANPVMSVPPPEQAKPSAQYGQPAKPSEAVPPPQRGFSAGDLIDQQSLPPWMSGQGVKNAQPDPGQATPGSLSPASLLDMNSLPVWMRDSGQQQSGSLPPAQPGPIHPAPNQAPWSSTQMQTPPLQQSPAWQPAPQQPMGTGNLPGAANGLSASSFIDPNALPEWLRSGGSEQPGVPQQQNLGAHHVAPRAENVRVPSRPRGEINPNEGNEAAANVFSSMLGVASSAPNFPAAPYGMPGGQMQQMPAGHVPGQGTGGLQNPQGYPPASFNSGIYQPGNPGSQVGYPMGNPGPQGGYQTGNLGQQSGGYQMSNAQANQYPMGMPPMQNSAVVPGGHVGGADLRSAAKPAKKGIFETIRDWFR